METEKEIIPTSSDILNKVPKLLTLDLYHKYLKIGDFIAFSREFQTLELISYRFRFTGRILQKIPEIEPTSRSFPCDVLASLNEYLEEVFIELSTNPELILIQQVPIPLTLYSQKYSPRSAEKDSQNLYRFNHNFICEIISKEEDYLLIPNYEMTLKRALSKNKLDLSMKLKIVSQFSELACFLKGFGICNCFHRFSRVFVAESYNQPIIKVADFSDARSFNPTKATKALTKAIEKVFETDAQSIEAFFIRAKSQNETNDELINRIRDLREQLLS